MVGLLGGWAAIWIMVHIAAPAGSWHFFVTGARLLTDSDDGSGALHLYASHPSLQIGPLSFIVAKPFAMIAGLSGFWLAAAGMILCGLLILVLVQRLTMFAVDVPADTFIACVIVFIPVWCELSIQSGHLDDVLAMTCAVIALWATLHRHPIVAAVAVGAAIDSKPWAIGFAALLLALESRHIPRAIAVVAATVLIAWLPFFLADHATMLAFQYQITNSPGSALRALGVATARTPQWCRTVQFGGGLLLGSLLALRRKPAGVLLVVIALRLLLDPGTHLYYGASLTVAAMIADLLVVRKPVPTLTIGAMLAVYLPGADGTWALVPSVAGYLRATYLIGAIVTVLTLELRPRIRTPHIARTRSSHH
jgi:hypothetical protein